MKTIINKMLGHRKQDTLIAWLFVAPWAIGFLIFGLYPIIMSLYYSLCQYDVLRVPRFIGLQNYSQLLFEDPYFWKSLWNTLYYVVFRTPLSIFGSLLLASMLNQQLKGMPIFRTIFFIPSIISGVVLSVIWLWMFNPEYGLINSGLAFFGLPGPLWLQSASWSKPALVLMSLWTVGGGRMLVFLAALQGIPRHLYEAVELEGGGWWTKFRHVTVPLISPILFLWTVMEVIFSMQVFVEAYIMTNGGPANSTLFFNLHLYNKSFNDFQMGYASAMAWLLLVITLVVTWFQFRLSRRMVYYEGGK